MIVATGAVEQAQLRATSWRSAMTSALTAISRRPSVQRRSVIFVAIAHLIVAVVESDHGRKRTQYVVIYAFAYGARRNFPKGQDEKKEKNQ
jgi:hypothetical protein